MYENMEQVRDYFKNRQQFGIQPGLERIERLLSLLGNPQEKFESVHVAGTNGKGSTIHFLEMALIENKYRVGVFTSPSMSGLIGHILINRQNISARSFLHIINEMIPLIKKMDQEGLHATEFEIVTAVSFVYFAQNVDIALIETGMGGREDTTNCIVPLLSIITSIGLDHTAYLGDTIEKIAAHKAGIIKDTIPVIIGSTQSDVTDIMRIEAETKKAPMYQMGKDFTYYNMVNHQVGQSYTWKDDKHVFQVILGMEGRHQVLNSSIALKALLLLREKGFSISDERVLNQLKNSQLAGRFEQVINCPPIILDGAHNPDGIESFVNAVSQKYRSSSKTLLFGAFKDKDIKHMVNLIAPYFEHVLLTPFEHPRSADEAELNSYTLGTHIEVINDWKPFLKEALKNASKENHVYFVAGSMNFVTQVRAMLLHL